MKYIIDKIAEIYNTIFNCKVLEKNIQYNIDGTPYAIGLYECDYIDGECELKMWDIQKTINSNIVISFYHNHISQYSYKTSDYKRHWLYYNKTRYDHFLFNNQVDLNIEFSNELQKELKLNDDMTIDIYNFNEECNKNEVLSTLFGVYIFHPNMEVLSLKDEIDLLYDNVHLCMKRIENEKHN